MAAIYKKGVEGGIKFESERRPGEVRIPNYVYDIWLPLLGAAVIGVYTVYCRLEREDVVKGMTLDDLARACRLGKKTLMDANDDLVKCGFIRVKKPQGKKRLMHHTTEIVVCDPPREISAKLVEEFKHPQGYQLLTPWLSELPEVLPKTSGGSNQNHDDVPDRTPKVATLLSSQPSDEEKRKEPSEAAKPTLTALALANTNAGTTNITTVDVSGSGQAPSLKVSPPAAPPHYTWLCSSDSLASMHLIADKGNQTNYNQQHALCETAVQHRSKFTPGLECVSRPCPECQRIAAETNLLLFALAHVTGADPNLNRDVKDLARDLQKAGYVAEDVATYEAIWRKGWQWTKNPGQKPGLEWLRLHIGEVKSDVGQSRYDPAYELTARIRELRAGEAIHDRRIRYANELDDHPALSAGDATLIEAVGVDEASREASA